MFQDAGTSNNFLIGNDIGTNVSGQVALSNSVDGIVLQGGTAGNQIGGSAAGERNVISGNARHGFLIGNRGSNSKLIIGNYIGTNADGSSGLANGSNGVIIGLGASNNDIGGDTSGLGNLLSANTHQGVMLQNAGTSGNRVMGNYIGTNAAGTAVLGNLGWGIFDRGSFWQYNRRRYIRRS